MNWREPDYDTEETAEERNWPQERWTWQQEVKPLFDDSICPVCKFSDFDKHYDREHDICPIYESARSEI